MYLPIGPPKGAALAVNRKLHTVQLYFPFEEKHIL